VVGGTANSCLPTHLCPGTQEISVSMRRIPASSKSPVCMGAPARAPAASVSLVFLAHAANKVPGSGSSPPPCWGLGTRHTTQVFVHTNQPPLFPTGSRHGTGESDWHLEGSGGNGTYSLWPARPAR
jgi:hypothetical protein